LEGEPLVWGSKLIEKTRFIYRNSVKLPNETVTANPSKWRREGGEGWDFSKFYANR
jgi:hypothetical protein